LKEHDDGIYRTIPYYAAKVLLELPTAAFAIFILGTIVYWMTNLYDNVQTYFILQGILILTTVIAISAGKLSRIEEIRWTYSFLSGSLIGVAAPTPEAAAALVVPLVIPLLVFAGFFVSTK
jgi:ABC-type multidrug transport system permease subunit